MINHFINIRIGINSNFLNFNKLIILFLIKSANELIIDYYYYYCNNY